MKLVYVAGPLRAADTWSVEQNIQIVERLALDVFGLGAYPVYVHPFARYTEGRRALAMRGSLELMRRCDALILAAGWDSSDGSVGEWNEMAKLGKPVFYTLDSLRVWIWTHNSILDAR